MISTPLQLRYSDFDMGKHVHNAVYLNYFEIGRVSFFLAGFGQDWDWKKEGLIIKKNIVEYHVPIFIEDAIHIEVECSHIGNKSFTLTYKVADKKGEIKATGESIVVSFDYHKNSTTEISSKMRAVLESHMV